MKPCFGYIRVSTLRQGEGVSLQEQKDAIIACAALRNLHIIEWFEELVDQGVPKTIRPEALALEHWQALAEKLK